MERIPPLEYRSPSKVMEPTQATRISFFAAIVGTLNAFWTFVGLVAWRLGPDRDLSPAVPTLAVVAIVLPTTVIGITIATVYRVGRYARPAMLLNGGTLIIAFVAIALAWIAWL